MSKQNEPNEPRFVDNAKDRMTMVAFMDKVKDVALFIVVTIILTWLVIGVL